MYKLSIIIPHFNSQESLKVLLDSIPASSWIQVIVIDDGSQSFDLDFLKESYKDFFFSLNTQGKGAGGARNTGLKIAQGEWVVFADADDCFLTNDFSDAIDKVLNNEADTDIVFFKPISFYLDTGKPAKRHIKYSSLVENYLDKQTDSNLIKLLFSHYVPWSKFIKLDLIKSNNIFFDETIIANDGMFSAKSAMFAKKVSCYQNSFYKVSVSSRSLTKVKRKDYFRVRIEVFTRLYHYLPNRIKSTIGMSPLSLVKMSISYGFKELFKTISYLKSNNVPLFKYFNVTSLLRYWKRK